MSKANDIRRSYRHFYKSLEKLKGKALLHRPSVEFVENILQRLRRVSSPPILPNPRKK